MHATRYRDIKYTMKSAVKVKYRGIRYLQSLSRLLVSSPYSGFHLSKGKIMSANGKATYIVQISIIKFW